MNVRHLNFAQRVILVIAIGVACVIVGTWVTQLGSRGFTGWTAYAPLSSSHSIGTIGGLHEWVRRVVWLLILVLWTVVSLVLLRVRPSDDGRDGDRDATT